MRHRRPRTGPFGEIQGLSLFCLFLSVGMEKEKGVVSFPLAPIQLPNLLLKANNSSPNFEEQVRSVS